MDARPSPPQYLRRIVQLVLGQALYGAAMALMLQARLGLDPWDIFHQGLSLRSGVSIGAVVVIVGVAVLLLWIPLRQRPGVGTVANVLIIGPSLDLTLRVLPPIHGLGFQAAALVASIVLTGFAGAAYIGAELGPGPRDGLMTGLHRRTGRSLRSLRTAIELAVLGLGWLLGGTVGVGTVLYAVTIGPLIQAFLPVVRVSGRPRTPVPVGAVESVGGSSSR